MAKEKKQDSGWQFPKALERLATKHSFDHRRSLRDRFSFIPRRLFIEDHERISPSRLRSTAKPLDLYGAIRE